MTYLIVLTLCYILCKYYRCPVVELALCRVRDPVVEADAGRTHPACHSAADQIQSDLNYLRWNQVVGGAKCNCCSICGRCRTEPASNLRIASPDIQEEEHDDSRKQPRLRGRHWNIFIYSRLLHLTFNKLDNYYTTVSLKADRCCRNEYR